MKTISFLENNSLLKTNKLEENYILKIGRNELNNICFSNKNISGFHAEVKLQNNKVFLKDSNSTNGTYVNDIKINQIQKW